MILAGYIFGSDSSTKLRKGLDGGEIFHYSILINTDGDRMRGNCGWMGVILLFIHYIAGRLFDNDRHIIENDRHICDND